MVFMEDVSMNILFWLTPKANVSCIYEDNSVRQGLEKMRAHSYTAIPVISKNGEYVGTITEGDFLRHLLEKEKVDLKEEESCPVREILREGFMEPVTVTATMEELLVKVMEQNFVPVVDDRNFFVGIITRKDIIKYFANAKSQENYRNNSCVEREKETL